MQFTTRDIIFTTTGVAFVLLSETKYSAFSRIVDTAPFELYPVVLPVLGILHVVSAVVPIGGKSPSSRETVQANGCKWTFGLFVLAAAGFAATILRRWEFAGPMAGMANCVNFVNTATFQLVAGVVATIALRVFRARNLFLIAVACISTMYCVGVLILHFAG